MRIGSTGPGLAERQHQPVGRSLKSPAGSKRCRRSAVATSRTSAAGKASRAVTGPSVVHLQQDAALAVHDRRGPRRVEQVQSRAAARGPAAARRQVLLRARATHISAARRWPAAGEVPAGLRRRRGSRRSGCPCPGRRGSPAGRPVRRSPCGCGPRPPGRCRRSGGGSTWPAATAASSPQASAAACRIGLHVGDVLLGRGLGDHVGLALLPQDRPEARPVPSRRPRAAGGALPSGSHCGRRRGRRPPRWRTRPGRRTPSPGRRRPAARSTRRRSRPGPAAGRRPRPTSPRRCRRPTTRCSRVRHLEPLVVAVGGVGLAGDQEHLADPDRLDRPAAGDLLTDPAADLQPIPAAGRDPDHGPGPPHVEPGPAAALALLGGEPDHPILPHLASGPGVEIAEHGDVRVAGGRDGSGLGPDRTGPVALDHLVGDRGGQTQRRGSAPASGPLRVRQPTRVSHRA